VVIFSIIVGVHALHPKRDRCPLLVSKRLCLVVNTEVTGRWTDSLCVRTASGDQRRGAEAVCVC
jgi:hypothetical protein